MSAFFRFCTHLNQALATKQSVLTVPYSRLVLLFVHSLRRNKLIYTYRILQTSGAYAPNLKIVIYLIYIYNLPLFSRLLLRTKKNQFNSQSHQTITTFHSHQNNKTIFYFQTPLGFLTHTEARSLGQGGRLIAKLA